MSISTGPNVWCSAPGTGAKIGKLAFTPERYRAPTPHLVGPLPPLFTPRCAPYFRLFVGVPLLFFEAAQERPSWRLGRLPPRIDGARGRRGRRRWSAVPVHGHFASSRGRSVVQPDE